MNFPDKFLIHNAMKEKDNERAFTLSPSANYKSFKK